MAQQLQNQSVDCFLPLYESVRRWKDRCAVVSLPLFAGYVFVRLALPDRRKVLTTPGVVNLVGAHGHPHVIPEEEVEALRHCYLQQVPMKPHPYLSVGRRVRVKSGPLRDVEGILVRRKNSYRFVLSVDLLNRSVAVEIDATYVAPMA